MGIFSQFFNKLNCNRLRHLFEAFGDRHELMHLLNSQQKPELNVQRDDFELFVLICILCNICRQVQALHEYQTVGRLRMFVPII